MTDLSCDTQTDVTYSKWRRSIEMRMWRYFVNTQKLPRVINKQMNKERRAY